MPKELTLPSGKIAILNQGKGKDLLEAQKKSKNSEEIPFALIAELVEIDGQKLVYEDILKMDLSDVIALQGEISGKLQGAQPAQEVKAQETQTETLTLQTDVAAAQKSPIAKA